MFKRSTPVLLAACAIIVLAAADAAAARAEATSPWWGVTSGARPTYLHPGTSRDEILELTVIGTEGDYAMYEEVPATGLGYVNHNTVAFLQPNLTAAQLQEALETKVFPGRRLSVSGGPEAGGAKYRITFPSEKVVPDAMKVVGFGVKPSVSEIQRGSSDGQLVVTAENLGNANANGEHSPIVVADTPPPGWEVTGLEAYVNGGPEEDKETNPLIECSLKRLSCSYLGILKPGSVIEERLFVTSHGAVSDEENEASAAGGGASAAGTTRAPVQIGDGEPPFGVESYRLDAEEPGGAPDTQAGSHPFQLTTTLALNQTAKERPAGAMAKDLLFDLPPGLIGNPTPFAQCTTADFLNIGRGEGGPVCSPGTIIGMALTTISLVTSSGQERYQMIPSPIWNLVPSAGEPARFAFKVVFVPVYLDTSVLTGDGYGVQVSIHSNSQGAGFIASRTTFWGVPGDSRHDGQRDNGQSGEGGAPSPEAHPAPFLSLPTSCTGPVQSDLHRRPVERSR